MSSTSTPTTTSSSSPKSTANPTNSSGSTNFFGFLIAFVAIVFVFVACGLGSRRRFVVRRRAMLTDIDPWALTPPTRQPEPKYWEPSLALGGGDWSTIRPLSVSVLHAEAEVQERRQAPRREVPPHTFSFFPLSSWIPFVRANPGAARPGGKLPEGMESHETEKPPDDLEVQVGVIVILPSAPRSEEQPDRRRLAEYQIGSVRVLWEVGTR